MFSDRLKNMRLHRGYTLDELAEKYNEKFDAGMNKGTLSKYENGKQEPMATVVYNLSLLLNCSTDYLYGITENFQPEKDVLYEINCDNARYGELQEIDDALNDEGHTQFTQYGHFLAQQPQYQQTRKRTPKVAPISQIRHYFTAAAAGYTSPIEGENYEIIALPPDAPRGADFCVDIAGDSMEPYIKDGSRVYVKRDVSLQQFDPGIFYYAGDVYCKQVRMDYSGAVNLLSANPKREDANIRIEKSELPYLVCFGKVILPYKLPEPDYSQKGYEKGNGRRTKKI